MLVLSYILTAIVGMILGILLSRLWSRRFPAGAARSEKKNYYKEIPAAAEYERYAARREGRAPNPAIIDPKPAEKENPFFPSFRRAWRSRLGLP